MFNLFLPVFNIEIALKYPIIHSLEKKLINCAKSILLYTFHQIILKDILTPEVLVENEQR